MTLDEARAILADEDASDTLKALEAIAIVVRHNGIAEPRLLPIAESIEAVVDEQRIAEHLGQRTRSAAM